MTDKKITQISKGFARFNSLLKQIPIILILCLLLSEKCVQGQSLLTRTIRHGLEYGYNFNWANAEKTFQGLIQRYPDDPRGYHYEASIYFWYYLSNEDKTNFNLFVAYSDSAIDKAKDYLDKNPDDNDVLYTIGSDYSYRTMAYVKAGKFLDAVWASKKSEDYLSNTLKNDSSYYDAYLGLGLYYFGVMQIPSAFRWALSLAGIHGNKKLGLKLIKKAANFGNFSRVEAEYYYSQILTEYLFEYELSSRYLQSLVNKYPGNLLFNYSLGALDIKRRKLNDAEKILNKVLTNDDENFKQITFFSGFLLGDIKFKQNQFEEAKTYYTSFINSTLNEDYKGIAYFRLAVCCELTGNRNDAVKYFSLTDKGNMDLEDDIFAKREGEIYSKRSMAQSEIDVMKFANMIDNGKYKAALDSLTDLLDRVKTDRLRSQVYLNLSEASYWLGNYDESLNYALSAKALDCSTEMWVKPYACYYAARALQKIGKDDMVKKYLDEADSFSNYDYQKKLKNLLSAISEGG